MKSKVNIGVCGLGTVGTGTVQLIQKNAALIKKRTGVEIQVTRAATVDPYENLDIDFSNITVSDSVDDILNDSDIDLVVELIGGDGLAKKIILDAFDKGKSVVTANKALIAKHSEEIFRAVFESPGMFGFEASVGGGIPIIRSIRTGFSGDRIDAFSGIMNGTANYILSAMTRENADFESALKLAQEKGFAEADPTFDIEGIDAAHKVTILMELAFNTLFDFDQLYIEGITRIEPVDIQLARQAGYTIKLIGIGRNLDSGFEGRVHPALVSNDNMLASVNGAFNAISVTGNFLGDTLSYGAGAGAHPTASAVVGDIIEISRRLSTLGGEQVPSLGVSFDRLEKSDLVSIEQIAFKYYLRCLLQNPDSELAVIQEKLAASGINVTGSYILESFEGSETPVAILTEEVVEKKMQETVAQLGDLEFIHSSMMLIRHVD
jgi:homoserine dehydrogenase